MSVIQVAPDPDYPTGVETDRVVNQGLAGRKNPGHLVLVRAARTLRALPLLLPVFLVTQPVAAQDCVIRRDDWDDIQRFRQCIDEHGLDAWTPWVLHQAARLTSNPTIVRLLLQAGADPNAPDDDGLTPLHHAVSNRNPMVATHLLDAGADLNTRENDGYTPLHYAAAQSGNGRVVKLLLDRGVDPLVESNDGRTPLHSALRYQAEASVVSALVEAGGAEHLTPLQLSALQGDSMAVTRLLSNGDDPNETDLYGWSSLHFAVPLAGSGVVSTLLAAGGDPNQRTAGGATALLIAARQSSQSVVSALLGTGADVDVRDEESDWTPLHAAARGNEDPGVVLILLDAGADAAAKSKDGQCPVDLARSNDAITGTKAYSRLSVNEPTPLTAGRRLSGELSSTDGVRWGLSYYDEWSFFATSGQSVVVTMESEDLDSYLIVLGDDGTEIAVDDDGGGDLNARASLRVSATGRYTILATTAGPEETGRYVIQVEVER